MGGFVKGDIVVLNFPFSDRSQTKRRPALVVATPQGDDVICARLRARHASTRTRFGWTNPTTRQAALIRAAEYLRTAYSRQTKQSSSTARGQITKGKLSEVLDRLMAVLKQP